MDAPTLRISPRRCAADSLQKTLATGLLLALAFLPAPSGAVEPSTDHEVVIIGAGVAGMYAAYELNNLGFDVKVLEARRRRFGMLHPPQAIGTTEVTTIAEGVTGDESVNWHYADIMDLDPNRLVQIFTQTAYDDMLFSVGGSTVLSTEATRGQNPEIYDYWDFYYEQEDYTGPDIDVETYLCDTLGVCRGHPGFHLYRSSFPGGEWMTRLDQIGMRSLAEMESLWDLGSGEWAFAYSSWTETLDELYFNSILHLVQLNSIVTEVDTSGEHAVVTWTGQHGQKAGSVTANAVLSTIPVGNLKAGDVTFTPPLPASKLAALDLLGVGNGGKMFLQFSSRFWPTSTNNFFTEGEAGYCWDYEYRGGDGGAVVVCYVVGENADVVDNLASEAQRINHVLSDLDTMYPGTPFSDAFVTGFWKRMDDMQFSKGGYTYPKPGSYPTDGSPSAREILGEPVGTKLYFAGAPTHNSWSSTVVGALDSGLRAAGEIDADHDPMITPPGVPAGSRWTLLVLSLTLLGMGTALFRRGHRMGSKPG
jgi:hypothetical protein